MPTSNANYVLYLIALLFIVFVLVKNKITFTTSSSKECVVVNNRIHRNNMPDKGAIKVKHMSVINTLYYYFKLWLVHDYIL